MLSISAFHLCHKFAHLNIKFSGLSLFVAYHFLVQTTKHVSLGRNLMVYQQVKMKMPADNRSISFVCESIYPPLQVYAPTVCMLCVNQLILIRDTAYPEHDQIVKETIICDLANSGRWFSKNFVPLIPLIRNNMHGKELTIYEIWSFVALLSSTLQLVILLIS